MYGTIKKSKDDEDVYVINSNDRLLARMEEYQDELAHREERQRQELLDRFYNSLEYDEEGKPIIPTDEEGYALVPMDDEGNPLVSFDEEGNLILPQDEMAEPEVSDEEFYEDEDMPMEDPGEIPARLLEDVQAQAQMILDDAKQQAQAMMEQAMEEGRDQGYQEGFAQGMQECGERQAELEAEHSRFMAELDEQRAQMEVELVDVICEVVDKTFNVMFSDNKELVLHLVDNALLNIENSRTFLIRVNEKNRDFLQENKEVLMERVGSDAQLDIIMDPLMDDSACMIETDGGIFDCGMDVQMRNLTKSLKALSLKHDQ